MNTWTTLLPPTELEKTFAPKDISNKTTKPKTVEIRTASGEIKRFVSIQQAAHILGILAPTLAYRCQNQRTDRQGNHYRYIKE